MTNEQFTKLAERHTSGFPQGWKITKRILQNRKTGIIDHANRVIIFNAPKVADITFSEESFSLCLNNAQRQLKRNTSDATSAV